MKLSFVIPVYNAENYIGRCLDSILDQDTDDFEIICINDGSKDNSLKVLEDYSKRYPGKFNIISQDNQGIGPARNNAFKLVKGEYTWFIDNDDCIQQNCLGSVLEIIEKEKADITNIAHLTGYFTENPLKKNSELKLTVKKYPRVMRCIFMKMLPGQRFIKLNF